jgi:hypothetical protein
VIRANSLRQALSSVSSILRVAIDHDLVNHAHVFGLASIPARNLAYLAGNVMPIHLQHGGAALTQLIE